MHQVVCTGRLLLLSLVLIGSVACGGATVSSVTGPGDVRCLATATPTQATVPPEGGRVNVTVSAARECTWHVSTASAWIELNRTGGQGSGTFTAVVAPNTRATPREALIAVNDSQVSITQAPPPCGFDLTSTSGRMSHAGGQARILVSTLEGCTWQATTDVPWLRVSSQPRQGPGVLEVEVLVNDGAERQGAVIVGGERFTILQDAAVTTPPGGVPPPGTPVPPPGDPVPPPADPVPPPADPVPPPVDPIPPPTDPPPPGGVPPPGNPVPPPGNPVPPPGDPVPPPTDPIPPPTDPAPPPVDPVPPPTDPPPPGGVPPPGNPVPPPGDPAPPANPVPPAGDPVPPPGAPTPPPPDPDASPLPSAAAAPAAALAV